MNFFFFPLKYVLGGFFSFPPCIFLYIYSPHHQRRIFFPPVGDVCMGWESVFSFFFFFLGGGGLLGAQRGPDNWRIFLYTRQNACIYDDYNGAD